MSDRPLLTDEEARASLDRQASWTKQDFEAYQAWQHAKKAAAAEAGRPAAPGGVIADPERAAFALDEDDQPRGPSAVPADGSTAAVMGRTDGLSSGAPGQVSMDLEALRYFIGHGLQDMIEDARTLTLRFQDAWVSHAGFSNNTAASTWGRQVLGTHHVFTEGMRGAVADLDRFQDLLRKSCENQERADDAAKAALMRAARRFDTGEMAAQTQFHSAAAGPAPAAPEAPAPTGAAPTEATPSGATPSGATPSGATPAGATPGPASTTGDQDGRIQ